MRFILLVEGRTERDSAAAFLKRWLDPQLTQPVGINVVSFDGYADLVRKMATKASLHLEGPKQGEIVAVIGLLDLIRSLQSRSAPICTTCCVRCFN